MPGLNEQYLYKIKYMMQFLTFLDVFFIFRIGWSRIGYTWFMIKSLGLDELKVWVGNENTRYQ